MALCDKRTVNTNSHTHTHIDKWQKGGDRSLPIFAPFDLVLRQVQHLVRSKKAKGADEVRLENPNKRKGRRSDDD